MRTPNDLGRAGRGSYIPALPSCIPVVGNTVRFIQMHRKHEFIRNLPHMCREHGSRATGWGILGLNVALPPIRRKVVACRDPQYARAVLSASPDDAGKPPSYSAAMKWLLGNGLVTADGDRWKTERRRLNKTMTGASVRRMLLIADKHAKQAVQHYGVGIDRNNGEAKLDLSDTTMAYTLDVIMESAFGAETNAKYGKRTALSEAIGVLADERISRTTDPPLEFVRQRSVRRRWKRVGPMYDLVREQVKQVVSERLEARRQSANAPGGPNSARVDDLLDAVVDALHGDGHGRDEQHPTATESAAMCTVDSWKSDADAKEVKGGAPSADTVASAPSMSDMAGTEEDDEDGLLQQAFAHVTTFLVAGHETTSALLGWCLLHLVRNPDMQERLRQEVRAAFSHAAAEQECSLSNVTMSQELIGQLPYLRKVLKETLRLTPSLGLLGREIRKPMRISREPTTAEKVDARKTGSTVSATSFNVAAGCHFAVSVLGIHTNELYWHEPLVFNPDRWDCSHEPVPGNEDGKVHRHPFQFIPFAAGPRHCIGQSFAMAEASVFLAHFIAAYSFVAETLPEDPYHETIGARPAGVVLRIRPCS